MGAMIKFRSSVASTARILLAAMFAVHGAVGAQAVEAPAAKQEKILKVAVTDLSYESKVSAHFVRYDRTSSGASSQNSNGAGGAYGASAQMQSQTTEHLETGREDFIDRGELRKFTADIKGELIKSRALRVVQGRPWVKKDTEQLYDIIARIKDGYYAEADYVLFGNINSVDIRREVQPIANTNAVNYTLNAEMVIEFSMINTKTYEVVASFSVHGDGSDGRLINAPGTAVTLSKVKAFSELSKSLGTQTAEALLAQINPGRGE